METIIQATVAKNGSTEMRQASLDWLVTFKDPRVLWEENWFALILEVASALLVLLSFIHARRQGSDSKYLILAAMATAFSFELFPFIPRPGYLLWWYHQGAVTFLKQRAPSYVICLYAFVHYTAHCATSRTNLPVLARSLLTSLSAMLVFVPCLWLAPRLLLLLLHFDDPLFAHRLFGLPYIQLVTMVFMFFHTSHIFQENYDCLEEKDRTFFNKLRCALLSGWVAAIYSIVEQYLLYISLHLTLRIHTAVCLLAGLAILANLAKNEMQEARFTSCFRTGLFSPLMRREWWILVASFAVLSVLPLAVGPEYLRSSGERLELGPCNVTHEVSNTSPLEIERRRYVCPNDTQILGFDFHCVPEPELSNSVSRVSERYTICGSPFENPEQLAKKIAIYSIVCLVLLHTVMSLSFQFKAQDSVESCKKLE